MPRTLRVTVGKQVYLTPEVWLAGTARTMTVQAAIQQWHDQAQMQRQFNRQRAK
jgi:hypothetical protein